MCQVRSRASCVTLPRPHMSRVASVVIATLVAFFSLQLPAAAFADILPEGQTIERGGVALEIV